MSTQGKAPTLVPGDVLGAYRIEEKLGEGAVGVVYRAGSAIAGETVALKVLKRELAGDDVYRQRFLHEARTAAEVEHRNLVPVLEAGEGDGRHFLVVAHVEGRSLADHLAGEGRMPVANVLRLTRHIGAGLDALHRAGLVHRDVKPSNIMLDSDEVAALTDFGLAKGPAYTVLTRTGQVVGTLDYLAPELIRGEQATPASDLYALGCVVFECLSGSPPFGGRSLFEVGTAHLLEEPPELTAIRPELDPSLAWAVVQALGKEPAQRPPTGTAYAHLLRAAAS
jgi:serine/threonine-protein kinase